MLKNIGCFLSVIIIILSFLQKKAYSIEGIINGSLSEMYDDNINAAEEKESDFITEIIFGLGLRHEGRATNWRLLGQSTQQIYYKTSELNNNAQSAELSIASELTSTDRINVSDRFAHYPEAQNFQEQFGSAGGRTGYYTNTATARYLKEFTSYFRTDIQYTNIYTNILNQSDTQNDSISHSAGFIARYEINSSNIFSIIYNYTYWKALNYDEAENATGNEKTILHNCALGYEFHFTRQFFISLQSGLAYVITEEEKNYNNFSTLSLIDQIDERNNLNISLSRRYEIIPLTNQTYNVWNFSITLTREISYFLDFSLSGFYQYGNTVSDVTTTKSELTGVRTGLSYRIFSEHVTAFIEYIYTKNITKQTRPTDVKTEYDRNQIRLGLRAEF
ncbi:MAG: hypothetical protein V1874_02745 [Spirochaetota bacterium]